MIDTGRTRTGPFLLDTDVTSYIFGKRPEAGPYLTLIEGAEVVISFVTLAETLRGALARRWSARRILTLEQHLAETYTILPYTVKVAREWASIVASCRSGGLAVSDNDAWVAACATTFDIEVVTHDHIFADIERLYPKLFVAGLSHPR